MAKDSGNQKLPLRLQTAQSDREGPNDSPFHLYERFRPEVPADERGWDAKGVLDLAKIEALAQRGPRR
jgi:hypothetical protein